MSRFLPVGLYVLGPPFFRPGAYLQCVPGQGLICRLENRGIDFPTKTVLKKQGATKTCGGPPFLDSFHTKQEGVISPPQNNYWGGGHLKPLHSTGAIVNTQGYYRPIRDCGPPKREDPGMF